MNVSLYFSWMLDIIHESSLEIFRREVGEGLQQGFLCPEVRNITADVGTSIVWST
jgi:hypothetical protein